MEGKREAEWTLARIREEIRAVTCVARPALVPELELRLVTGQSAWWRLDPNDLARRGIPEPYWAFAWAGGQVLARYLLDHPETVRGRSVIDFGAGGGIVALAAARAAAASITVTEVDPWAIEACRMNLMGFGDRLTFSLDDWIGRPLPAGSLLLLGDMHYESELTSRLLPWFQSLREVTILVGDPHRGFLAREAFDELASYRAPMDSDDAGLLRGRASVLRYRQPAINDPCRPSYSAD